MTETVTQTRRRDSVRPAARTRRRRSLALRWGMIAPSLVAILLLIAFPLVYTIDLSFTDTTGSSDGLTLGNYADALTDKYRFWPAVGRTIVFTLTALTLEMVFGIAIAVLLRRRFPGSAVVRTIVLLPLVTSQVAVGAVWMLILDPNTGIVNEGLAALGLNRIGFLSDPTISFFTVIALDVWQWTPLVALIVTAGLTGVPAEPEEASLVDGASAWQRLRLVTLPMIRATLLTAAVLRGIEALKTFDIIYATKGPGGGSSNEVETLNVLVYGYSFDYMEFGLASAILVMFFILVLAAAVTVVRQSRKEF